MIKKEITELLALVGIFFLSYIVIDFITRLINVLYFTI